MASNLDKIQSSKWLLPSDFLTISNAFTLRLFLLAVVLILISPVSGWTEDAPTLTIGSSAPSISVEAWTSGHPVETLDRDQIYVVEFWATWCGPCASLIPHLNELAEALHAQVKFLSVTPYEREITSERNLALIGEFQQRVPFSPHISVALALPEMAVQWEEASLSASIPNAYIVNGEGQIAWIGYPEDIDEPLQKIIDGKWDMASFKETHKLTLDNNRKEKLYREKRSELEKQKRWADILRLTEKYLEDLPKGEDGVRSMDIFDLVITDMLIKLNRLDEAVESIIKWGDDFDNRSLLDYVEALLPLPKFRKLMQTRLPQLRDFIKRVSEREDIMKRIGFLLASQMADVENAIGESSKALELRRLTLKYIPILENSEFSKDMLQEVLARNQSPPEECPGGSCEIPKSSTPKPDCDALLSTTSGPSELNKK